MFCSQLPLDLAFDDTRQDACRTKLGYSTCSGSLRIVCFWNKHELGELETLRLGEKNTDGSERVEWLNIRV